MKVLPRHILEMPLLGQVGIDLYLGQKPKLGGEVCRQLTHLYIIFCQDFVYIYVSLSFFFFVVPILLMLSKSQKDQKYFYYFSLFASLAF
jgi:hypothetical protein